MLKFCQTLIRYSFYLLFFLVPLVFFAGSYELFEFNKMMLTYALTIIIVTAWLTKLIITEGLNPSAWFKSVRRTPFDLVIILYLVSHIISTVISLDVHTSIFGYYTRFHEGLLATISYVLLYFAAVSNLKKPDVLKIFYSSFLSAVLVSLWGIAEHFGQSLSCYLINPYKGGVDCWIQDVKSRVFATLGQPNWMAAYLDVLILTTVGFIVKLAAESKLIIQKPKNSGGLRINFLTIVSGLLAIFFTALLFTKSRSGFLGLMVGLAIFAGIYIYTMLRSKQLSLSIFKPFLPVIAVLLFLSVIFSLPFPEIEKYSLENMLSKKSSAETAKPKVDTGYIDIGISESGDIRKIVWTGAVKVWQRYPLFGSGVETFAYAYYKDRPAAHNMVSEWDFLYNKAHNEFLNILATTGTVGMITYLLLIAAYTFWLLKSLRHPMSASGYLVVAFFAAYASILVTNFFGFSVVIIGLFFFLLPAFSLILSGDDVSPPAKSNNSPGLRSSQWIAIIILTLAALFLENSLVTIWRADKAFAYGKNLDGVQQYTDAYPYLATAINLNPDEPTLRDELSYNEAILASAIFNQATGSAEQKLNTPISGSNISAASLAKRAIDDSNKVVEISPNALTFWKTRTKLFYLLGTIDKSFYIQALTAIQKSAELAPTDAKVHYNLGLLLAQTGNIPEALKIFQETTKLKPDYLDAHYALGLYLSEIGQKDQARAEMEFIITHIGPDDRAKKWLEENK